ncbi:aldo/keto reductase [Candidatus Latescibacterota bacterium]
MKRRSFLTKCSAGMMGMGITGCAATRPKKIQLYKEIAPFSPRPDGGTMPMTELGKTGIKVSKMTFGSHIRAEMTPYYKQREYMIHEAFDMGINVFDVYDDEKGSSLEPSMQYEPLGRQIAPFKNDALVSISFRPYDGRTPQQELERDLRLFGKDSIDLVRILREPDDEIWDFLFKNKEKGNIRAIGAPIHDIEHVDMLVGKVPLDYILFPYNFYHNICWLGDLGESFETLPDRLRKNGIGVLTMKPFGGDYLAKPFINIAHEFTKEKEIKLPGAALRYILNSGINAESTFIGMYNLSNLYENIGAYFNPEMSAEEKELLENIRNVATQEAKAILPDHYKWLENWAKKPAGKTETDIA